MADFSRQLQGFLQASSANLLERSQTPKSLLSFLRDVEQFSVDENLRPIIVYWSNTGVFRLLPSGKGFGTLVRESALVAYFENISTPNSPDEWGYFIQSKDLNLAIYGQLLKHPEPVNETYMCIGSAAPIAVTNSINFLKSYWAQMNPADANLLDLKLEELATANTTPRNFLYLKEKWEAA